ncbi:glycosyltransferase family 2 protein [Geobacter sp. DSM 9736]|uniref:glycosyltransferase family 2 protein n=1 Tax=Geobacter sp. DSM 9736 TaxID=1277350 RepID=UPI000B60CAB5|nr:glycosyltransferase family 2 protein [Geobacter sp. DSM 9736]SNB46599.1 Glycosyltransferase involved in cell wall bisynthesis [Geobacter sp. DSM 9736]
MKFSIITVTWNSSRYLQETIDSVLGQDFPSFEYIIVDGGSTDGTLSIIAENAARDGRIRWISEADDGISDAFNKGIRMACGEIIGIINSDDTYCPGAFKAVALAREAHPECDVFHGDMIRMENDVPLFLLKPTPVGPNIWREMPVNHPATFVTRRGYETAGLFDTDLRVTMDYDLILRLYIEGCRFYYVELPLAAMRYGGESDARTWQVLREFYRVTRRYGYPRAQAAFWFMYRAVMVGTKNMLRKLGIHSLIRLHPRFNKVRKQGSHKEQ